MSKTKIEIKHSGANNLHGLIKTAMENFQMQSRPKELFLCKTGDFTFYEKPENDGVRVHMVVQSGQYIGLCIFEHFAIFSKTKHIRELSIDSFFSLICATSITPLIKWEGNKISESINFLNLDKINYHCGSQYVYSELKCDNNLSHLSRYYFDYSNLLGLNNA